MNADCPGKVRWPGRDPKSRGETKTEEHQKFAFLIDWRQGCPTIGSSKEVLVIIVGRLVHHPTRNPGHDFTFTPFVLFDLPVQFAVCFGLEQGHEVNSAPKFFTLQLTAELLRSTTRK